MDGSNQSKKWQKRVKRGSLWAAASISACLIALTFRWLPLYFDTRNYVSDIRSGASIGRLEVDAEKLASKYRSFTRDLERPGINLISQFLPVNLPSISKEVSALIETSPDTLGFGKVKKYLIAVQNSAEARGTGGILGAYAIVEVKRGKISIIKASSNADFPSEPYTPLKMPDEFTNLYGNDPGIFQNSNLSPHFPYGARIWMKLWTDRNGGKLDGVIAIDPTAISYVLRATGPITSSTGEQFDESNVVRKTLKDLYKRYEFDNVGRKQFLVTLMDAMFAKLQNGSYDKIAMAKAFRQMVLDRRLLFYSTDSHTQKIIGPSLFGSEMSLENNKEFRAVVLNTDASKLDYYLARNVNVITENCGKDSSTRIEVVLKNNVTKPKELPDYVLTRADKGQPKVLKTGQHRFRLFLYGPTHSKLVGALRSNQKGPSPTLSVERNRPLLVVDIDLAPQASEKVTAVFHGGSGAVTFIDQPLVIPTVVRLQDSCHGK